MEFRKITTPRIYEQAAEEIKKMIIQQNLKPGDKFLSVRELSERFQVSRSAIREALSALKAVGLVVMKQGGGTFIGPGTDGGAEIRTAGEAGGVVMADFIGQMGINELLEVRKILETGNASVASVKRTEEDLTLMAELLKEMENGLGNEEAGRKADIEFHLAIAKATQNHGLVALIHMISAKMRQTMSETRRMWIYSQQASSERLWKEHQAIFEAIEARNGNLARELMLNHLLKVEEVLFKLE